MDEIDYKALLIKYVKHVTFTHGGNFLYYIEEGITEQEFTDKEKEALKEIQKELID